MPTAPVAPLSLRVPANGLEHHVLEWPAAGAATVLLLHGYMDAAATWDLVAPALAAKGLRAIAPDLRGYGDGARVSAGGYYHFVDYVFDLADIVEALVPQGSPLFLVGHSMGGTVANLYAGTFPERVTRLALLEGSGPADNKHDVSPDRLRRWVEDVRAIRARPLRRMSTREDALRRLADNHPRVGEEILRGRLDALASPVPDGGFAWKADPLHTTRSPVPFFAANWKAFARRVTCPVLFVGGGPLGWHPEDEEQRVDAFAVVERTELRDAGHMMHWTEPAKLTRLLLEFFGGDVIAGAQAP
ncbi:MAG TPA: alpha/beta hydrolase [Polyangiaceae bacterium]|jgi:pimeloyl-ACP methyl ester carboxylesterase|nr:alpha/beta hydrolase [Polyangiaceae bacterium]